MTCLLFHITLILNYSNNVSASVAEGHKSQVTHREIFGYF